MPSRALMRTNSTPSLRRAGSELSIVSDTDPESQASDNLNKHLLQAKAICKAILDEEDLSAEVLNLAHKIQDTIATAIKAEKAQLKLIKRLNQNLGEERKKHNKTAKQLEQTKNNIKEAVIGPAAAGVISRTVAETISSCIEKALQGSAAAPEEKLEEIKVSLREQAERMEGVKALLSTATPTNKATERENQYSSRLSRELESKQASRTLVLNPVSVTPGEIIKAELLNQKIQTKAKNQKIATKPAHLKIICRTKTHKDTLKSAIESNQTLNKLVACREKSTKLYKLIIPSAAEDIPFAELKTTICGNLDVDISMLTQEKQMRSRRLGHKAWTFLAPLKVAQVLVFEGAFYHGLHKCIVRPFTTVARCRRCQVLGHSTPQCIAPAVACARCSEPGHEEATCTKKPTCINCKNSQGESKSEHQPSDPKCHAYLAYLGAEREKMDELMPSKFHMRNSRQGPQEEEVHNRRPDTSTRDKPIAV